MSDYLLRRAAIGRAVLVGVAIVSAGGVPAGAQNNDPEDAATAPALELTPGQRSAIYEAVSKDKRKAAPSRFGTAVGSEVPPMIELYMLPDDILSANPAAKFYKYTMVDDRVVLIDPVRMRVIAVIGPRRME